MMKKRKQTLVDQLWMFNGNNNNSSSISNNNNDINNDDINNHNNSSSSNNNNNLTATALYNNQSKIPLQQVKQSKNSFSLHYSQSLTSSELCFSFDFSLLNMGVCSSLHQQQQYLHSLSLLYPYINISTSIVLDMLRVDYNNNICLIKLLKLERIVEDLQAISNITIKLISKNSTSSRSSSSNSSSSSRINCSYGSRTMNKNRNDYRNYYKNQSTAVTAKKEAAKRALSIEQLL
jgi:hypothetical protein